MRAKHIVDRLLETGPDDVDPRQYVKTTLPWWEDLDDFTEAYMEAALWSSNDNSDESGGEPLDRNYSIDDIAFETVKVMAEDCLRFQTENAQDLSQYDLGNSEWNAAQQGGHDFWLSRNGHGVGFFDRDSLPDDVRDRLQVAAEHFGEVNLYVGDDEQIYQE